MRSDESEEVDELYRGGTSESRSFEDKTSPVNPLRLSGHRLLKPQMSPNSYDSDDAGLKMFSRE